MGAEGAICGLGTGGLGLVSMIAFGAIALGLFSVFGGKFSKKDSDQMEIPATS